MRRLLLAVPVALLGFATACGTSTSGTRVGQPPSATTAPATTTAGGSPGAGTAAATGAPPDIGAGVDASPTTAGRTSADPRGGQTGVAPALGPGGDPAARPTLPGTHRTAPTTTDTRASTPTQPVRPTGVTPPIAGGHRGGSGGARVTPPALPPDFPSDVPIPPAPLQGSSGSAGRWGVLLLAAGPADRVLTSTVSFYISAGFTAQGPGTVHRGRYTITIVAENRDHSNTETNLALGVTRS